MFLAMIISVFVTGCAGLSVNDVGDEKSEYVYRIKEVWKTNALHPSFNMVSIEQCTKDNWSGEIKSCTPLEGKWARDVSDPTGKMMQAGTVIGGAFLLHDAIRNQNVSPGNSTVIDNDNSSKSQSKSQNTNVNANINSNRNSNSNRNYNKNYNSNRNYNKNYNRQSQSQRQSGSITGGNGGCQGNCS